MKTHTATYYLFAVLVAIQVASGFIMWYGFDKTVEVQESLTSAYMLLQSVSWVFAFSIISMLAKGLFRQLVWIMILLWCGQIVDDLFFDPTTPDWNDLVNLVVAENLAVIAITCNRKKT